MRLDSSGHTEKSIAALNSFFPLDNKETKVNEPGVGSGWPISRATWLFKSNRSVEISR